MTTSLKETLQRAFQNARFSPALAKWISSAVPPNNDIRAGLRALRARSRDAAQNDDHCRQFLRLVETNIVGPAGVLVKSTVEDRAIADTLDRAYERQSMRGTWDVTGQHSRKSFMRLLVRTVAQDGEALIRIHEGERFAVELIDAEMLDIEFNRQFDDGSSISMGVERDRFSKPLAYHVFAGPPPLHSYRSGNVQRERIPASEILHVFLPEWIGQSRGVPWTSTALGRMKMLTGYEEAAVTGARGAAIKTAVYTQKIEAAPGSLPAGEIDGDNVTQELTPGQIEMAPHGWDLKPLDWHWPNVEHGDFIKACLRGIASGLGVSAHALTGDLESVNYSSLRQGALSDRDIWMWKQSWLVDWAERPVREKWISWAARSGAVDIGRVPTEIESLYPANYQGRRWPWVDPQRDIAAAREAVELRTRSLSGIIREQGAVPEEVWTELYADLQTIAEIGLEQDED